MGLFGKSTTAKARKFDVAKFILIRDEANKEIREAINRGERFPKAHEKNLDGFWEWLSNDPSGFKSKASDTHFERSKPNRSTKISAIEKFLPKSMKCVAEALAILYDTNFRPGGGKEQGMKPSEIGTTAEDASPLTAADIKVIDMDIEVNSINRDGATNVNELAPKMSANDPRAGKLSRSDRNSYRAQVREAAAYDEVPPGRRRNVLVTSGTYVEGIQAFIQKINLASGAQELPCESQAQLVSRLLGNLEEKTAKMERSLAETRRAIAALTETLTKAPEDAQQSLLRGEEVEKEVLQNLQSEYDIISNKLKAEEDGYEKTEEILEEEGQEDVNEEEGLIDGAP